MESWHKDVIEEIMQITGLGRSSVHGYLPYIKIIYNMKELSATAMRMNHYRERRDAVSQFEGLVEATKGNDPTQLEDSLWNIVELFEVYPFITFRGLKFR